MSPISRILDPAPLLYLEVIAYARSWQAPVVMMMEFGLLYIVPLIVHGDVDVFPNMNRIHGYLTTS